MADETGRLADGLPRPGQVLTRDHRPAAVAAQARQDVAAGDIGGGLRVVQWNIERGYELEAIIDHLKEWDADIIGIQEIDIACDRSNNEDVGTALATALGMNYVFCCEFEELRSPLRSQRDQGGGVHGNGILTRFDVDHTWRIEHQHQYVDWEREGDAMGEPRNGRRYTLGAVVVTPFGPISCYSAHLELFCGITGRVAQFSEIFQDARVRRKQFPMQMILADLNTFGHSVVRLSGKYMKDHLRWKTLGYTEAEWFDEFVLSFRDGDGPFNPALTEAGCSETVATCARNPDLFDPFDVYHDVTLNNPKYFGLVQGKLDWVLLGGLDATQTAIGNHDYAASDHKSLVVDVRPGNGADDWVPFPRRRCRGRPLAWALAWGAAIGLLVAVMIWLLGPPLPGTSAPWG